MITLNMGRKNDIVEIKFEVNKELECKLEGNYNIFNNNNSNNRNNSENDSNAYEQ